MFPLFVGVVRLGLVRLFSSIILMGKTELVALIYFIVFLMSCDCKCSVALPRAVVAVGSGVYPIFSRYVGLGIACLLFHFIIIVFLLVLCGSSSRCRDG